jgi:dynein heavy chain
MRECTNENEDDTIFIDFFDENAPNVYQEVSYAERQKLKSIVEDKLK